MKKVDIAGLKIDALTKSDLLTLIRRRMSVGQKTWITTPYSEFLYAGLRDNRVFEMLNKADIAVPDGIGIFWAKKYLDIPLTAKSYWGKVLQALWQLKYSLAAILFNRRWIKRALPEKIVGADLVWDLANLAAENNFSLFLLGGYGNVPETSGAKLKSFANIKSGRTLSLQVSNKNPSDPTVVEDIKQARPDILLIAYGPIKQERWIADNLAKLDVKLVMGVGGSFDYIAGVKSAPPKFIRAEGLEWLWRLFTQPRRLPRIINATFGLASGLCHYKVFMSHPLRGSGVGVILNADGKIFLARKIHSGVDIQFYQSPEKWKNYWQFPQGGIEKNENLTEAVKRETMEETGITNLQFLMISKATNSYIWNNAVRKFWHNRKYPFKGQSQKIVYFKYSNDSTNIELPKNEEFIEYRWVNQEDLLNTIHQDRRPLAKIVIEDLKEMREKGII